MSACQTARDHMGRTPSTLATVRVEMADPNRLPHAPASEERALDELISDRGISVCLSCLLSVLRLMAQPTANIPDHPGELTD